MPAKPSLPPPPTAEPSIYPALESFIEWATTDDVKAFFAPIREGLAELKGPKAAHAGKINGALDDCLALLTDLLLVRERLEAEHKNAKRMK